MNSYKTIAFGIMLAAFSSTTFSAATITNAFNQVSGELNGVANQAVGTYMNVANQAAEAITNAINSTTGTATTTTNPQQQMEILSNDLFQQELHFFKTACTGDNVSSLEFLLNIMTPRLTYIQMFMEFEKTNAHKSMILLLQQNLISIHEYPQALAWAAFLDASIFHRIMHFEKVSPQELNAALTFAQQNFAQINETRSQAAVALLQASKNALVAQTTASIPTAPTAVAQAA